MEWLAPGGAALVDANVCEVGVELEGKEKKNLGGKEVLMRWSGKKKTVCSDSVGDCVLPLLLSVWPLARKM